MLIEEKQNGGVLHRAQRLTFSVLDRILAAHAYEFGYHYAGFFVTISGATGRKGSSCGRDLAIDTCGLLLSLCCDGQLVHSRPGTVQAKIGHSMPTDWYRDKPRRRISPTDKVSLKLTDRQRALIIEHTFAPDYVIDSIRAEPVAVGDTHPPVAFTLDEWEVLHGDVAAEANHCDERNLRRELDRVCDCIQEILDTYTDQD
jgi:hypothetical protein